MRAFFFCPSSRDRKLQLAFERVMQALSSAGVETYVGDGHRKPESREGDESPSLDQVDAVILEGSTQHENVGYLLAMAIARKLPTLYVSDRTSRGSNPLQYLPPKHLPKFLTVRTYTIEGLEGIVMTFLRSIDGGTLHEVPSIKFTLRVTPTIDKFLDWKTNNTELTKADYLREEIERIIKDDEGFQSFLKKGE